MKKYPKFKIATAVITALALLFCTTNLPVEAKRDSVTTLTARHS